MFRHSLKSLSRKKLVIGSSLVLMLILTSVPASIGSLQTNRISTTQSISKFARGSYDILVRPSEAVTDVEKSKGLVEENYLTGGEGGISLEQYQKIKNIPGIDVAAPISVVGFFANDTGGIKYVIPNSDKPGITSITFHNQTGLGSQYNYTETTNIISFPYKDMPILPDRPLDLKPSKQGTLISMTIPTRYDLLVAVDPRQEDNLIHMDEKISTKLSDQVSTSLNKMNMISPDGKPIPDLPILINADLQVPMLVELQTRDPQESAEILKKKVMSAKTLSDVDNSIRNELNISPVKTNSYSLTQFLKPFQTTYLQISDNKIESDVGGLSSFKNSSVYYTTDRLHYKLSNDGKSDFTLVPDNTGNQSSYRFLQRKGLTDDQTKKFVLYDLDVQGSFHGNQVNNSKLNPSPLGIYSFSDVMQIVDPNGKKTNVKLQKDMTPDTFLPIQAAGLTNLKAAEIVKGPKPIDAIRIRVAGIQVYDAHAEQKILQVADAIRNSTGLHTDIVAGASKQNVKVEVPAVGNRPSVGIIQEVWTTLGVSTKIISETNQLAVLITVALACIVLLYTIVHTKTLFVLREKEFHILKALGWKNKDIRKLLLLEWTVKLIISLVCSYVPLLLMKHFISFQLNWLLTLPIQLVIVALLIFANYVTAFSIQNKKATLGKEMEWKRNIVQLHSISTMSFGNFLAQFSYNRLNILLIAISGGVALFTLNTILAIQSNIGKTFLGNVVNAATNSSQWVIVASAVTTVIVGIYEASNVLVSKREQEFFILRTLGWSTNQSMKLIHGEISIVLFIGLFLAVLLGVSVFFIFFTSLPMSLLIQIGVVLLMFAVLALIMGNKIKKIGSKIV